MLKYKSEEYFNSCISCHAQHIIMHTQGHTVIHTFEYEVSEGESPLLTG